jgi:hypothetical protein
MYVKGISETILLRQEKLNKLEFSDNCTLGKQHKVKFRVTVHNSSRLFEYVFLNLWGPVSISYTFESKSCLSLSCIIIGFSFKTNFVLKKTL